MPGTNNQASEEEKAVAKAKAIKGGFDPVAANNVFKMQMGSKSATNSESAFAMKDENTMYMSALFNAGHGGAPGHTHGSTRVPTYDTTNISANTSAGGSSSSSSSSGSGKSYAQAYESADKNKYPTLEAFTEAAKSYNQNKSSNSGNQSGSRNIISNTKTTQVGDKSEADINIEGVTAETNRINKAKALKEGITNQAVIDSTNVTNQKMSQLSIKDQLNPTSKGYIAAVAAGNAAARGTLSEGGAHSEKEMYDMFKNITSGGRTVGGTTYDTSGQIEKTTRNVQNNKLSKDSATVRIENLTNPGTHGSFGQNNPTQKKALEDAGLNMQLPEGALKFYNRKK